jgi:hypothetical protein
MSALTSLKSLTRDCGPPQSHSEGLFKTQCLDPEVQLWGRWRVCMSHQSLANCNCCFSATIVRM